MVYFFNNCNSFLYKRIENSAKNFKMVNDELEILLMKIVVNSKQFTKIFGATQGSIL